MSPIAIFYHCLFYRDNHQGPLPVALDIAKAQVSEIIESELLAHTSDFVVGINGGPESLLPAGVVFPPEAKLVFHGLKCHTENRTLLTLQDWLPGHEAWLVLYLHCKGATRPPGETLRENWRACMMRNLVSRWRRCVSDLESGYDSVGCHWMSGDKTPPGQSIWAGNFWWARANYLMTLPSMMERARIVESGLDAVESRYESEVWIGNGPKLPKVKDYHPAWIDQCVAA